MASIDQKGMDEVDSNQFSGQKILVTGASGYIGPHLCHRLCKSDVEVHAIYRTKYFSEEKGLKWWQCDLTDLEAVQTLFTRIKPDVIFHMAGHAAGGRDLELVMPTFKSNLITTVNLLTVATEIGCHRIILPGSLEEPDSVSPEVIPSSPYAASKWASSAYARMFHKLYKTPVVILRVFMAYGPGKQNPLKLVPYVIKSLFNGQAPKLSSGHRQIDWVYIEDVIDGLISAAQIASVEGCSIDIGSGTSVTTRIFVENLAKLIDPNIKPIFGVLPDRSMEQVQVANIVDAYAKISWRPKTSLENGLKNTVDWYREQLKKADETVFSNNTY